MSDNPFLSAGSVEELREMEKAIYEECFEDGKMLEGCEEQYQRQMELFEDAFASLFPDDYDYHKRGRQAKP